MNYLVIIFKNYSFIIKIRSIRKKKLLKKRIFDYLKKYEDTYILKKQF